MATAPLPPPLPRIDPTATAASLLPAPPETSQSPIYLGKDLAAVPELMLEAAQAATTNEWRRRKAHAVAAAIHLNREEEDGYLKAVLHTRTDLAGLPFTMGDACRTTGERAKKFKEEAESILRQDGAALLPRTHIQDGGGHVYDQLYQAQLAVVTQVIPVKDAAVQRSLLRGVSSIPRPEATQTLARLAVFSPEEHVRTAALEALSVRREQDATDVLVAGLSYPWPAVAENAATAIAKLNRKDLVPQLESMLKAPDPRSPRTEKVDGQERIVAPELVRINHLRNCLLCHAPAARDKTPDETLVAEVPVPTMSLPETRFGYGRSDSDLLVRVDVTYLRQDFSAMQQVTDWTVAAWSPKQRFDFLMRKRVLTAAEAAELRGRLAGESPYQRAAARALSVLSAREQH